MEFPTVLKRIENTPIHEAAPLSLRQREPLHHRILLGIYDGPIKKKRIVHNCEAKEKLFLGLSFFFLYYNQSVELSSAP